MSERNVKAAVKSYLTDTFVTRRPFIFFKDETLYTVKTEHQIQFGSKKGFADVVLFAGRCLVAIVECKGLGKTGEGIEQLQSYLCASQARLGVFANSVSPNEWTYLLKSPTNEFTEINALSFHFRVRRAHKEQVTIEREIEQQRSEYVAVEAKNRVTHAAVQERANQMIEIEAKRRVTESAIQGEVAQQLEKKINQLQLKIKSQRQEIDSQSGCAVWGWILFGITLFILIGIASA